jgi:hypothetical protein
MIPHAMIRSSAESSMKDFFDLSPAVNRIIKASVVTGGPTVRNVARIKLGYYPLPPAETARLPSLLRFAPGASALDPCAGTGAALHELTAGARVEKHAVELDAERAAVAAASGIATVHGNLFDTVSRVESFSFLYLNPPYDSEIGFMGNKRMEYLFLEHTGVRTPGAAVRIASTSV